MADFENEHLKGKSLEQLIDELARGYAYPQSVVGEAMKPAVQAKMVERLRYIGTPAQPGSAQVPGARRTPALARVILAGQGHVVDPKMMAAVLRPFFG